MTLLTTEIHNHDVPGKALIVFAADRRITAGQVSAGEKEKVFKLNAMNGGLGYFGLAEIPHRGPRDSMADWLRDFLKDQSNIKNLETFANKLCESLNTQVPLKHITTEVSGFHIAGFNSQKEPEFWYVRNVADDRKTLFGEYQVREDFRRRDIHSLEAGEAQIYRNGDIRAHVTAWEAIDKSLGSLLNTVDFKQLTTPNDYLSWVKFKMETIAKFYEEYCTRSIIGPPIDAFYLTQG